MGQSPPGAFVDDADGTGLPLEVFPVSEECDDIAIPKRAIPKELAKRTVAVF